MSRQIGEVLTILANRRPVSPALTIQDMNIHNANSIGGNNMSGPIYWRRRNHILNRHGGSNLEEVYIASPN